MERHRDIRRGNMAAAAAANGISRRRPRSSASTTTSNSFRDSPEDDGTVELQETTRLRDRAGKKERDRLNRNKRRRGERLMLGGHRDDGGEESTEDSIDDDEDEEDDESSHVRMRPPNPTSSSAHANHHLHRKSYPPAATVASSSKVVKSTTWKVSDEMSFSVPKKARSACIKRTHESYVSVGGGGGVVGGSGEQIHRQTSTSPARPSPAPTPAPTSPSSSTASIRKKMKPIGAKPKHKPPKPSPIIQDDIEIEVAEVLYGLMRQSQCPSRQESVANSSPKPDSRDVNGSVNDAKSRVSSPNSAPPLQSNKLPPNSSSTTTPVSAVAPKRKRPRPIKFEDENTAIFASRNDSTSSSKIESEQPTKTEASSTKLDKNSGSNESRSGVALDFGSSQATNVQMDAQPESKTESSLITESKPVTEEFVVRAEDQAHDNTTWVTSPKKESSSSKVDFNPESVTASKVTATSVSESHREEMFKIDLMAPPSKSSPERECEIDSEMLQKLEPGELKENVDINCKKDVEAGVVGFEKKTEEATVDECESQKPIVQKHTMLDLKIDPPKDNKDCGSSVVRQQQQLHTLQQQQHPPKAIRNEPKLEIADHVSSMPLPMGATGWPGGLAPMGNGLGQIRPIQGMTSLDGTPGSSNTIQPPHQVPTQPRPKRCATHYYIARNIYYHQQFTKMSPFWPTAAGSASLYGNKPYNLNVMPPTETAIIANPLSGNFASKNLSSMQDRGQPEGAKDKSSVAANFMDSSQGKTVPKQMVLQQPPQQSPIQGPALIFPMNQQQAVVASGSKNGAAKATNTVNASPSVAVQSAAGAQGNLSASAAGPATMTFNYPNMGGNEAQYVAILQNNGYQFPVPAPSSYRGTAPPAMPFYNGPFYSSQMMQLQQQHMQQSHSQQQPSQQGHQNASTSSGSSSSQKHQQHNHHQRLQGSGSNAASGTSNSFPASKNRQQKQQTQSFPVAHQVRHHDTDVTVEDGPSQEDNRISLANKNAYSHNFAMPTHSKNFASLSSAALASGTGNHTDRQQQQHQHQSSKGGAEATPNQTFAMPFTSFNGGTTISGLDFSSMAQNHVIFQSLPDAARHGYQIAAQTAQQKKNHQLLEEGKTVSDSNNATEDERKAAAGKGLPSGSQAIVFSRTDAGDPSVSTILGNSVVESSARTLNLISSSGNGNRNSRPNTSTAAALTTTTANASFSQQLQQKQQQQQQQQQQQHPQMGQLIQIQQLQQMHLMRQQQQMHHQIAAAAAARGKPSATNSPSVYTDSLSSSSSMAAKFSNTHYYPEALIQGGSSAQSPQWKNTRTAVSSSSSPCLASTPSSLKNLPQQQGRVQQGHTQISFGANSKSGSAQHVQQIPTGNQSPSSPVVVGSPPPTSISKSAGGSPRASSSTGNKMISAPSLSQAKTCSSGPSRKSSPVGGRNAPSNLGNSHINPAPCSTTKSSQSHQHQQALHQQQKQALHQAQLYFSSAAYMQAQSPQSNSSTSNTTGGAPNSVYYQQRRQPPEQQQQQQLASNAPLLTLASTTSDPTKAVAAATAANMKGGLPPPGLIHAAQFATQSGGHQYMSTAFPYIHSVPSVQVKSGEQKQPTGNENLH